MIRTVLRRGVRDDVAYFLPMAVFLLLTAAGGTWPGLYPLSYLLKTVLVAGLLIWLWPAYTPIRWSHWWLGILVGILGILQWVPMQLLLQRHFAFFRPGDNVFDPTAHFSGGLLYAFLAIRIAGAVLLVPVMEELFWRDFAWRTLIAPNDFKLATVGEWDWKAFVFVPLIFATVHGNWALTAVVWAFLIGALLLYTRSLGACILAHATTNLLLAVYVLRWRDWAFW